MNRKRLPLLLFVLLALTACQRSPVRLDAPADHPPTVRAALSDASFSWISAETARFHLHALTDTQSAEGLGELGEAAEKAYQRNLELLGEAPDPSRIELLFVPTREAMARIVGRPSNGYALPDERAVVYVDSEHREPALQHELMHVVSWQRWGRPGGYWLSEGLATYSVGACAGMDFDRLVAALRRDGHYVPLATLRTAFFEADDVAAYLESASLVGYLFNQYGRDAARQMWQQGLRGVEAVLGRSAERLEADWLAHLDTVTPYAEPWARLRTTITTEGCE